MIWLPTTTIGMLMAKPEHDQPNVAFGRRRNRHDVVETHHQVGDKDRPHRGEQPIAGGDRAQAACVFGDEPDADPEPASTAPTSLSQGSTSRLITKNVSTMRSTIAPSTPQKMPCRRARGDRLRQARAITTALSPDSRILTKMIATTASQNCGVVNSAIRVLLRKA